MNHPCLRGVYSLEARGEIDDWGGRVAEPGRALTAAAVGVGVTGVEGGRGVPGALPPFTAAPSSCSTTQHIMHIMLHATVMQMI